MSLSSLPSDIYRYAVPEVYYRAHARLSLPDKLTSRRAAVSLAGPSLRERTARSIEGRRGGEAGRERGRKGERRGRRDRVGRMLNGFSCFR